MNPVIYNVCTIILYLVEITLGLLPGVDIGPLFGFIGTFSGVGISYFLPSLFLIYGYREFQDERYRQANTGFTKLAWINLLMGVFFFFMFLANNVMEFIPSKHEPKVVNFCNEHIGLSYTEMQTCLYTEAKPPSKN